MAKPTKIVPRDGKNGIRFFVSDDGLEAYKILANGIRVNVRATPTTCPNSKVLNDARRKQRYLQFKDALGKSRNILVSHAVHLAWMGPIPEGYVVDHLNGITTDNRAENLQAITPAENRKRAKLLRIIRKCAETDNRPDLLPENRSRAELLDIFNNYEFTNPQNID